MIRTIRHKGLKRLHEDDDPRGVIAEHADKLRDILSKGLNGIAFSAERADEASVERNGIENLRSLVGMPQPAIYSAEASLYVLRAGAAGYTAALVYQRYGAVFKCLHLVISRGQMMSAPAAAFFESSRRGPNSAPCAAG